jgi:hypothetical protein
MFSTSIKAPSPHVARPSIPKQLFFSKGFVLNPTLLNFKASLTEKKEHLEKLEQQNSRLEHEVKRFQEREKHLEKIRVLEKKKPWAVSITITR